VISGFEKIPKQLKDEEQMLSTMDHQVMEFARRLRIMSREALRLRTEALSPPDEDFNSLKLDK